MNPDAIFDDMVKQLTSQIHRRGHLLKDLPLTLRAVLGDNQWHQPMWKERFDASTGEVVRFDRFEDFVETSPSAGLGTNLEMLKAICLGDDATLDLLDQAVQQKRGNPTGANQHAGGNGTNRTISSRLPPESRQGILRSLRNNAPALHEKVLAGEMTVAQAAKAAGIRKPRVAISLSNPHSAAMTIAKKASPEFISELVNLLNHQRSGTDEP